MYILSRRSVCKMSNTVNLGQVVFFCEEGIYYFARVSDVSVQKVAIVSSLAAWNSDIHELSKIPFEKKLHPLQVITPQSISGNPYLSNEVEIVVNGCICNARRYRI